MDETQASDLNLINEYIELIVKVVVSPKVGLNRNINQNNFR